MADRAQGAAARGDDLARVVASLRAEAAEQLAVRLIKGVDVGLRDRLNRLLEVGAGSRVSGARERALWRVAKIREIGGGGLDLSPLPETRVLALARYGMSAKASTLRQLTELRRPAVLVATVRHLELKAIDDALDRLEMLMQTKLLARAERESAKELLRTLRRFAAASAKLAAAIQILLDATAAADDTSVAECGTRSSAWSREARWRPPWRRSCSSPHHPTRMRTMRGGVSCQAVPDDPPLPAPPDRGYRIRSSGGRPAGGRRGAPPARAPGAQGQEKDKKMTREEIAADLGLQISAWVAAWWRASTASPSWCRWPPSTRDPTPATSV